MKKTIANLVSYIEANRPIIYIDTFDFDAFDSILNTINADLNYAIYEFNDGLGLVDAKTKVANTANWTADAFLKAMLENNHQKQFVVLKDFHANFDNPKIVSLLKSIALKMLNNDTYQTTVFIVSCKLVIPLELEKLITVYEIPLPDKNECLTIIQDFADELEIDVSESVLSKLGLYLKGFSEFEIKQILSLAYQKSGSLKESDIDFVLAEKEQIIKKTGMLKIMNFDEQLDDVGGLENLKEWVQTKAKIFNNLDQAIKFGVSIPKGVLIVGMPGCGKSLTAKATANLFHVPLLQLDVGKLLGKYVGESEENMRRVLHIAEAISPVVLWIDEIEKAFSGVGSESGHEVTTRLFGYFLTWLQEKDSSVFVVATSNDISRLPPEFLRKGRFDEIFFADFPNDDERQKIIKLHLEKRGKWNKDIDTIELTKRTKEYTGADIESVILAAIEKAFLSGTKTITTQDIINEIEATKSMAVALKDKIDGLKKALDKLDVKPASKGAEK